MRCVCVCYDITHIAPHHSIITHTTSHTPHRINHTTLHYTTAIQHTTPHYITAHYITPHHTTPHKTTSHNTAPHHPHDTTHNITHTTSHYTATIHTSDTYATHVHQKKRLRPVNTDLATPPDTQSVDRWTGACDVVRCGVV